MAPTVVLLFSELHDVHALVVQARIKRELGGLASVVDPKQYPRCIGLTHGFSGRSEWTIKDQEKEFGSEDVRGVWLRRMNAPEIAPEIREREARFFAYSEAKDALLGLIAGLRNVVNPLSAEHLSMRKPYQLGVAQDIGLAVPETLISNDPVELRSFYEQLDGSVIFKVLTTTRFPFSVTRVVEPDHLPFLHRCALAP